MSPAKGNVLGLTQKSMLETIWRMVKSSPTIFAGDRAWILGCRYRTCSSRSHRAVVRVYDDAGNVIEKDEHKGDFKEP
jgi:hypothetical protein